MIEETFEISNTLSEGSQIKVTPEKKYYLDASLLELVFPNGSIVKLNRNEWRVLMKFASYPPGSLLTEEDFQGILPLGSLAVTINGIRNKFGGPGTIHCARTQGYMINYNRIILHVVWNKTAIHN